jgi:hypothetical protein
VSLVERNRRAIDSTGWTWQWLSPALFSPETALAARLEETARGELLDVGCEDTPYRIRVGP